MRTLPTIVACVFLCSAAEAEDTRDSPTQQDKSSAVSSITQIPADVLGALKHLCKGCVFADFGAPWNPTDVLNNFPQRRLLEAVHFDSKWRIRYNHGGRGRHTHTVVFSLVPSIHLIEGSSCLPERDGYCEW
jgi:hypothetical protein